MTHRRGFEADAVIDMLRNRAVPVFRFNSDDGEHASYTSYNIRKENTDIRLTCDAREIDTSNIAVGWCQQNPPYLRQTATDMQCLQRENLWAAQLALSDILCVPWLNRPRCVLSASNKILQLMQAQRLGMPIMQTLISNDPKRIRGFASEVPVVAKNLATPWMPTSKNHLDAAYTKIVCSDWLACDEDLAFCPVIYQTYCARRADYRVVVVDQRTFAARCKPNEWQHEDIRHGSLIESLYEACTFDSGILQKLTTLMKDLSVNYCSADFMEDTRGNIYFLELNVCGAWWWIDRVYNGAVCKAIADYLQSHLH